MRYYVSLHKGVRLEEVKYEGCLVSWRLIKADKSSLKL